MLPASSRSPLLPSTASPSSMSTMSKVLGVGIVSGVEVLWVICIVLFICCKKKRRRLCSAYPSIPISVGICNFTADEVRVMTGHFSEANRLGEGAFGPVYSGVLPSGVGVAVKRLKVGSTQGEREFLAEVGIISRVHHKHVVSLLGYCTTGSERMLVYELVPNNTLESHLHGEGQPTLEWPNRMKIALGSAKGLAYLHEDCHPEIIHRDIKASNILLDFKFEAKIADFGLAKFTSELGASSRPMGTIGYVDPEYAASGELTVKIDSYSFGVVLLELITGRRPVGSTHNSVENLVNWARPHLISALNNGNFDSLVDLRLQNNYNYNEMACMVACAAACVRPSAQRPRMSRIVRALEGNVDLNDGISLDPLDSRSEGPSFQTAPDLEMGRMERDSQAFSGGS